MTDNYKIVIGFEPYEVIPLGELPETIHEKVTLALPQVLTPFEHEGKPHIDTGGPMLIELTPNEEGLNRDDLIEWLESDQGQSSLLNKHSLYQKVVFEEGLKQWNTS